MEFRTVLEKEIREVKDGMKCQTFQVGGDQYPLWNTCTHTFIDLSQLDDAEAENHFHTLSVKLPTGGFVTLCVMPYGSYAPAGDGCIDIQFHGAERETRVIAFTGGRDERVRGDFYSLVFEKP